MSRSRTLVLTAARNASENESRRSLFQFQRALCAALAPDFKLLPAIAEHVIVETTARGERGRSFRHRAEASAREAQARASSAPKNAREAMLLFDALEDESDLAFADAEASLRVAGKALAPSQLAARAAELVTRAKSLPKFAERIVIDGAAALSAADLTFLAALARRMEQGDAVVEVSVPLVHRALDATRAANALESFSDTVNRTLSTTSTARDVKLARASHGVLGSAFAEARAATEAIRDALTRGHEPSDCVILVPDRSPRATLFALGRELRRARIPHAIAADPEAHLGRALDACDDRARSAPSWSDWITSPWVDAAFAGSEDAAREQRRAVQKQLLRTPGLPRVNVATMATWAFWAPTERATLQTFAAWLSRCGESVPLAEACARYEAYLGENPWVTELREAAVEHELSTQVPLHALLESVARFASEARTLPAGAENDVRVVRLGRHVDVPRARVVVVIDADRTTLDEPDDAWRSVERDVARDPNGARGVTLEHARRLVQVFDACEDGGELTLLRTALSSQGEPTEPSAALEIAVGGADAAFDVATTGRARAASATSPSDDRSEAEGEASPELPLALVPRDDLPLDDAAAALPAARSPEMRAWSEARGRIARAREDFFRDPKRTPSPLAATISPTPYERDVLTRTTGGVVSPLSVTALERIASCAFRGYAYGVLRIRDVAAGEFGPREEGMLTHEAIELAFSSVKKALAAKQREPASILAAAERAIDEHLGKTAIPSPLVMLELGRAKRAAMAQLGVFLEEERFDLAATEQTFGAGEERQGWPVLEFTDDSETLRLRGTIDRVDRDRTMSHVRIIDYKRSLSTVLTAPRELGTSVFQAPVYAHAAKLALDVDVATGAYVTFSVRAADELASQAAGLADALATMLADVPSETQRGFARLGERSAKRPLPLVGALSLALVKRVRDGKLAPIPRDESTCATCRARSVCRKPRFVLPADPNAMGDES